MEPLLPAGSDWCNFRKRGSSGACKTSDRIGERRCGFGRGPSRLLKKSERAVKNHEQIGIKTGPFMNQSAATLSFSTACLDCAGAFCSREVYPLRERMSGYLLPLFGAAK